MAISPPNFCKDAIPTIKGWVSPKNGELLKSQKISQAEIDLYMGVTPASDPIPEDLESLTKVELEELAREKGVELDRRKRKDDLVSSVRKLFSK